LAPIDLDRLRNSVGLNEKESEDLKEYLKNPSTEGAKQK
jgi:hypothetical protein